MEVGGSYAGFSASVGMDFDKFKQSDTFRQNYGSHQYTLQSGSDSLPEPISLKLETIDLALDPIYWQRYDELVASGICASDDQQHLQTRKSNLERALTEYAAYKMAPTPLACLHLCTMYQLFTRSICCLPGSSSKWRKEMMALSKNSLYGNQEDNVLF